MEVAQAIKYGIPGMLRANEHQILYEIESRLHDCSTEHEEYMTFWIASHKDHETATDMFDKAGIAAKAFVDAARTFVFIDNVTIMTALDDCKSVTKQIMEKVSLPRHQ